MEKFINKAAQEKEAVQAFLKVQSHLNAGWKIPPWWPHQPQPQPLYAVPLYGVETPDQKR